MRSRAARFAAVALAVAFVFALVAAPAYAKSYSVSKVAIEAVVSPDGSMLVTEQRTFDFNGDYTFAYWELVNGGPLDAQQYGRYATIEVLGMSGPEGAYSITDDFNALETRPPQTYMVTDYGSTVDVRAFFRASNTELPLTLTYRVHGAAIRWSDTAELYWQFIGEGWEIDARDVSVHIVLPEGVERADVQAWAHGPLTGDVTLNDNGTVDLTLDRLPAYTFVEARLLFPTGALSGADPIGEPRKQVVLDEEAEWASSANRTRTVARVQMVFWLLLLGIGPVVALVWAYRYWRAHGKEYTPQFQGQYFREEPANLPPAQVSALLNMGPPDDKALTATLMDLIDRGVIAIERVYHEKSALLGLMKSDVETYRLTRVPGKMGGTSRSEQKLMSFLFDTMARADSFTMEELKEINKSKSRADEWLEGVNEYEAAVTEEIEARGFLEQKGGKAVGGFMALGFLVMFSGLGPLIFAGTGWFLVWTMPIGLAIAILGGSMKRRSPEAAELAAKYEAVKQYLLDFGRMDEKPPTSIVLWRHFLTLAVVFGIAEQVMKDLTIKLPEIMVDPMMGTWMWMSTPGSSGLSPMSSLSTGMVSVASVAASHNTSSSGGGGGFSGGGGGGGGGGAG